MYHFCTISTVSHLYKTFALADSLAALGDCKLHVLVVDGTAPLKHSNCSFYQLQSLSGNLKAEKVVAKYSNNNDKLRWCLKPVWLNYLLQSKDLNVSKLIYLDNDLFFYSNYSFLFELLDSNNYLLTPHYYRQSPAEKQNWFEANFRVGLYNAGFFGANKNSTNGLDWWADCCLYRCEKSAVRGLFDDQKYLDLLPVVEEKVYVLKHKGCNLAGWNKEVCARNKVGDDILVEGFYPVVFVHFNNMTVREILEGEDGILLPHFSKYFETLKKYNPELTQESMLQSIAFTDKLKFAAWKLFTELGF